MPQFVRVRSQFVGWHKWKDAPDDVAFLRDFHRHVFKVELVVPVRHGDREVEFFTLQKQLDGFLARNYAGRKFLESCEQIAKQIGLIFQAHEVTVSEDGENDGIWIPETMPQPLQRTLVMENQVPVWQVKDDSEADRKPDLLTEVKTRVFVGIEAEGPDRGLVTVFIPGSLRPRDVEAAFNVLDEKRFPYKQVYYGAGNDRQVRSDTLAAIIDRIKATSRYNPPKLSMECHTWADFDQTVSFGVMAGKHFPQEFLVVTFGDRENIPEYGNCWTKQITPAGIVWTSRSGTEHVTKIDDPLFSFDKYVDQL